jgi:hypothetical protein
MVRKAFAQEEPSEWSPSFETWRVAGVRFEGTAGEIWADWSGTTRLVKRKKAASASARLTDAQARGHVRRGGAENVSSRRRGGTRGSGS